MARQRTFFHKCHRCIYRGQAANWEPEEAPMVLNVHAAEEPAGDQHDLEHEPGRDRFRRGAGEAVRGANHEVVELIDGIQTGHFSGGLPLSDALAVVAGIGHPRGLREG